MSHHPSTFLPLDGKNPEVTKDTFMEQVGSYIIFKIGILSTYVLIPIGVVGNTLSIFCNG